jgi:hypothetical protein
MSTLLAIAAVVLIGFGVFAWYHEKDREPPALRGDVDE